MSFTFSSNYQTDYLAIGACDICAKRLTSGCEHSSDMEHQEWLAAQVVAEAGGVDEETFITLIAFAEACDTIPNPAEIAFDLEAIPEAEAQAAEVERDTQWLDSAPNRNHLPHTNANGNLQWQGVEFDIQAIAERTKEYSAGLKAQIDERTKAVQALNAEAKKNVRLGGVL